jgi:hypothetical protein
MLSSSNVPLFIAPVGTILIAKVYRYFSDSSGMVKWVNQLGNMIREFGSGSNV